VVAFTPPAPGDETTVPANAETPPAPVVELAAFGFGAYEVLPY
jgi:hypothetical protein